MKFGIDYLSRVICKGSALFTRKRCAYTDFLNVKNVFILESQLQETMNHATECWFSWRAGRKQVANWLTMPMFVYFKLKKSRKMEEKNLNGAQIYIFNILDNSHETSLLVSKTSSYGSRATSQICGTPLYSATDFKEWSVCRHVCLLRLWSRSLFSGIHSLTSLIFLHTVL